MNEEVHTLVDGALTAVKRPGRRGRWEYALGFPVDDGYIWIYGPHGSAHVVIDDNTAERLVRLINTHLGETHE